MKKSLFLIIAILFKMQMIFCQNLSIQETLNYLSELCSAENDLFPEYPAEYIFSNKEDKIVIKIKTYLPSYKSNCNFNYILDIRKLKNIESEYTDFAKYNISLNTVNIIFEKNSVKFSFDCSGEASQYLDNLQIIFKNKDAAQRYINAMTYLKNKMILAYPIKPDPFK